MKEKTDGEEDDPEDMGEEESVVEPSAPEGGGKEEEDVETCQSKETESD